MAKWATEPAMRLGMLRAAGVEGDLDVEPIAAAWTIEATADSDAVGWPLSKTGKVAWCQPRGEDRFALLAIAPHKDLEPGVIPAGALFRARWPETWITARRVGLGGEKPAVVAVAPAVGGFCYGLIGNARRTVLARIEAVEGGRIVRVRVAGEPDDCAASSPGVVTWWVAGKWLRGFEKLWRGGHAFWTNYRLLLARAAFHEKRAG